MLQALHLVLKELNFTWKDSMLTQTYIRLLVKSVSTLASD